MRKWSGFGKACDLRPTDVRRLPARRGERPALPWRASRTARRPRRSRCSNYLAGQPGRLIPKRELLERVWPGVYVTDAVLKTTVRDLRRALERRFARRRATSKPRTAAGIASSRRLSWRRRCGTAAQVRASAAALGAPAHLCTPRTRREVRAQRFGEHRVSGDRLRSARHRVRDGVGVAPRILLERAVVRAIPDAAGVERAADPVRQARHRAFRSGAGQPSCRRSSSASTMCAR